MPDIFSYHKTSKSPVASPRQAIVSILNGDAEDYGDHDIGQEFLMQDQVGETQEQVDDAQEQVDEAIKSIRQEMSEVKENSRQAKLNQEVNKAIEQSKLELEALRAQFEIEVLAREEKQEKMGKLHTKLDKFTDIFKRESKDIHARFSLDKLERDEAKSQITKFGKSLENMYEKINNIEERMTSLEINLMDKDNNISTHLIENYLLRRLAILANGVVIEGILIEVSSDYLVMINADDIFITPVERIDSVSLPT